MFGYVNPDEYNLYVKDVALYKALYCGLCKSIGKGCNRVARLSVSYDITFISALLHAIEGVDVVVNKEHCAVHWVTKRPVAKPDKISIMLGQLNVILAYHKLLDDKEDEKKGGLKRSVFAGAYKKAKRAYPEFDAIVREERIALSQLEKKKCDSYDIVADSSARMLARLVQAMHCKAFTQELYDFCYALGKWIYLADALDDFEKDVKQGRYNVFAAANPAISTQTDLMKRAGEEIQMLFAFTLSAMQNAYSSLVFQFNHDLLDNIVYKGIPKKTETLFQKGVKK